MIDVLTLSRALRKFAGRVLDQDFLSYFLELHYARTDPFWESTRAHDVSRQQFTLFTRDGNEPDFFTYPHT